MLPFAIFMSDAKEKAKKFRSKYQVTLLKKFESKKLIKKLNDLFLVYCCTNFRMGPRLYFYKNKRQSLQKRGPTQFTYVIKINSFINQNLI